MAIAKDQIKTDYPLPVYNYRVDIGSETVAFSEISGLEIALEAITYKESQVASGIAGPNRMYMPGNPKPLTITMKKGLVVAKSIPVLYNWIQSTELNRVEKKDITVHLCDEKGESVVRWKIIDAFPTKLSAPSFNANTNEVAIETMELMATRMEMSEGKYLRDNRAGRVYDSRKRVLRIPALPNRIEFTLTDEHVWHLTKNNSQPRIRFRYTTTKLPWAVM